MKENRLIHPNKNPIPAAFFQTTFFAAVYSAPSRIVSSNRPKVSNTFCVCLLDSIIVLKPHFPASPPCCKAVSQSPPRSAQPEAVEKYFLSSFLIINFFINHQKQEGESGAYTEPQAKRCVWPNEDMPGVIPGGRRLFFVLRKRGPRLNSGKNVTHASFKQKGSIVALVRTDCEGMHIVLT